MATHKTFNENLSGLDLEMIYVPDGEFMMGALEADQIPQHRVTVPAFYLSKNPISHAQWRMVMGYDSNNPRPNPDDAHPVTCVNWNEAKEFCKKLNAWFYRPYRLPSEAEWEYACRSEMLADVMWSEVSEWCEDVWHENYEGAPTDGTAWADVEDVTDDRVVRGRLSNSYTHPCDKHPAKRYRCSRNTQNFIFPDFIAGSGIGFRVVITASIL